MPNESPPEKIESLLATPDLAEALESEAFRRFLDQAPIALVVSRLQEHERIIYANPEFEKLTGLEAAGLEGGSWAALEARPAGEAAASEGALGDAIVAGGDYLGVFVVAQAEGPGRFVDVYSNVIEDDSGAPVFRIAALVAVPGDGGGREELLRQLAEKDVALKEIQHRVRNNLQMIAALIRYEARSAPSGAARAPFDEIAGRIEAIQLLYKSLSEGAAPQEVDLGAYLSQIASAVMRAHAREGVRLDLKADAYPVSLNVAMPAGLVVNELMTNALKYAFEGRENGSITLHSLVEGETCRVMIADDGKGLPEGFEWPRRGKLSALIVRSLRENARAELTVDSRPGEGLRVTILFSRAAAQKEAAAD